MTFESWWQINKDLYGLVGVSKEVAKAIWSDAVHYSQSPILQQIKEIRDSLS